MTIVVAGTPKTTPTLSGYGTRAFVDIPARLCSIIDALKSSQGLSEYVPHGSIALQSPTTDGLGGDYRSPSRDHPTQAACRWSGAVRSSNRVFHKLRLASRAVLDQRIGLGKSLRDFGRGLHFVG